MSAPLETEPVFPRSRLGGLSGKLLALILLFVFIGEIFIFLPSIANYRVQWLKTRIAQAEIAALAIEAAPDQMVSEELRTDLLSGAGVAAVSLKRGNTKRLVLRADNLPMLEAQFDLRSGLNPPEVVEALAVMARSGDRLIGVTDAAPGAPDGTVEIALHEAHLRAALRGFARDMLLLSILLSIIVGALVFWALTELLVKPIERLSANMVGFAERPEDRSRIISPRPDGDEIAAAERALAAMQNELSGMLAQKNHLAALGLAVSKVSHDLRNMLTSAQLLSDRLGHVNDPTVQKVAPKLISSLDRAIGFLTQTLQFGRAQEPPPEKERIVLKPLVKEVFAVTALSSGGRVKLINAVDDKAVVEADREQLTRILGNLIRNAVQALDQDDRSAKPQAAVTIATRRERHTLHISVADNGPGIPEAVRGKLFQAFHASATPGGTGLGLAIAAELAEAHGGGLALVKSDETGTVLELTLPAPESQARAGARTQGLPSPGQRIMNRPLKRR